MVKVFDTLPEPGTTLDWDVDEITSRLSGDLPWYFPDDSSIDPDYAYGYWDSDQLADVTTEQIQEAWETCIRVKSEDSHYQGLLEEIRTNGFTKPVNAYISDGQLRLCDGHHRVAVAVELGIPAIPVKVSKKVKVDEDSGSWRPDSEFYDDPFNMFF